jgi:2-polyprenyl-6-methoxyphenol hydroxylase-like FAD-dependent oxidoreductase
MKIRTGHAQNGHAQNGHAQNGHAQNGHAQNGHAQNGGPATRHVRGRADIHGHAVTGAEGLRSPIRAQMIGDGDPRISRHTAWRSVIPTALMPEDLRWNAATLWAGPNAISCISR